MTDIDIRSLAENLTVTALQAGIVTLKYFKSDDAGVMSKADGSPVTLADQEAEVLILEDLKKLVPDIPVIAEEAVSRGEIPEVGSRFFLVDPLDGTREFTGGSGQYTVNIGLVEDGKAIFGIVYAPALGDLYVTLGADEAVHAKIADPAAAAESGFRSLQFAPMKTSDVSSDGLTVVASRSHGSAEGEAWLEALPMPVIGRRNIGSSLKFCLVAAGEADLYPRHGPTMEWDTSAGHAVLSAAGGIVTKLDGAPFVYGKTDEGYRNTGFIAYSGEALKAKLSVGS